MLLGDVSFEEVDWIFACGTGINRQRIDKSISYVLVAGKLDCRFADTTNKVNLLKIFIVIESVILSFLLPGQTWRMGKTRLTM